MGNLISANKFTFALLQIKPLTSWLVTAASNSVRVQHACRYESRAALSLADYTRGMPYSGCIGATLTGWTNRWSRRTQSDEQNQRKRTRGACGSPVRKVEVSITLTPKPLVS